MEKRHKKREAFASLYYRYLWALGPWQHCIFLTICLAVTPLLSTITFFILPPVLFNEKVENLYNRLSQRGGCGQIFL